MNPFVFMPPFAGAEQIQQAKERAEMLKEEWRLANWRNPGNGPERKPDLLTRIRQAAGRALLGIGSRLAGPASGRGRVGTAQRTGC